MQMILIERCTFYLPTANIIRTKAKVRVSPKGWRTVFGRFADCKDKQYSRNLQTFNSLLLYLQEKTKGLPHTMVETVPHIINGKNYFLTG